MRRSLFLAPALLLLTACPQLDPAAMYRDAARQLNFTLDSVEPRVELGFPLDRSRLVLRLRLGVQNPSSVHFKLKALGARIFLDEGQTVRPIGGVSLPQGLDLRPSQNNTIPVDLSFTYGELKQVWGPLSSAISNNRSATWRLEGEAQLEAMGFPINLPVRATKHTGKP